MATLSIPQKNLAPDGIDFRTRALRTWLDSLPPTRPIDAAAELFGRLQRVNRSIVAPEDRAQFIAACRPAVDVVLEELGHVYGHASIPPGERAREALAASRALAAELSIAYRVSVVDRASRIIAFGAQRQIPALLLEAAECLLAVIASSYRAYTPVPPGAWQQLHEIFLYAEERGFAGEGAEQAPGRSIELAYCEALLLALADPYRLSPAEMERMLPIAGFAMAAAKVHRQAPQTPSSAHFAVACESDRPPKPVTTARLEPGTEGLRVLDTNGVIGRLRERRAALRGGVPQAGNRDADDLALIEKLLTLWGHPPKRAFRREAGMDTVAICAGLAAVRHFVAHESGVDPGEEAANDYSVIEWDVIDQGAGGLKVRRQRPPQAIAVGEVLGVKMPGRARWIVGVARWVKTDDAGTVEFGIQFLSPGARVVWIQPTIAASPRLRPGLVLERTGSRSGTEALMTPPNMFSELREFEVTDGPGAACVRATELIERTPKFELFEFSG